MTDDPLAYQQPPLPEDCVFKISPSKFSDFISSPHNWYRTEVLGENKFSHNTSSVLGKVVHYCAEQVSKGDEVDKDAIRHHVSKQEIKDDYDPQTVMDNYVSMAETLVNDYVLENDFLEVETPHIAEIKDGYYAGGTVDRIQGIMEDCMVCDYKSYHSKTKPKAIPQNYRYQLLVYCWILIQCGYNPTRIRLIYINRNIDGEISQSTGKRLKSYPPEVTVLTETITPDDIDFIEGLLHLCVDTVEAGKKFPELTHVIWHDPRLKVA